MTLEQAIAAKARSLVAAQREESDSLHERETAYRSLCESFPILLRSAGLVQSLAWLEAQGEGEYNALYRHLNEHFSGLNLLDNAELLASKVAAAGFEMPRYRYYSHVALKVAFWHKRLAQALLRQKPKDRQEPQP